MSTTTISLADHQLEQLADLIAARLAGTSTTPDLVTVEGLATILKVDAKTIYRHAEALGAIRVGRRLRFDPAKALGAWHAPDLAASSGSAPVVTKPHKRAAAARAGGLLPVGRRA